MCTCSRWYDDNSTSHIESHVTKCAMSTISSGQYDNPASVMASTCSGSVLPGANNCNSLPGTADSTVT